MSSSTWTICHVRRLRPLVAACLLGLLAAPVAHADFKPVSEPLAGLSVDGFAASQGAWMVGLTNAVSPASVARISRDRGQSWSSVTFPAGPSSSVGVFSGVTVGPDGAFYVASRYPVAVAPGAFARLLRIAPGTGAGSIVGTLPLPSGSAALSAPAFDTQGRPWVAWIASGSATLTVARIADGTVAESHQAPAPTTAYANGEIQFRSSGMWVRMGNTTYRLSGGALVLAPQGIPTLEDGSLTVTQNQISLDGGRSFLSNYQGATAVEGNPGLLASYYGIMRRYSPALFTTTDQTWPNGVAVINRVVATDGGLVAFSDEWRHPRITTQGWRMLWHPGAVTDPSTTGPLSATFTNWLAQANAFRAQAGLPPLLGDSAISTAAENHSRYWTLNTLAPGGDAHSETPGTPGFTGRSPSERCAAAGGPDSCGEIMYPPKVTNPVAGWIATAFHRGLIMDPASLRVGGGQVPGGWAVMDGNYSRVLQIGPFMFPQGVYSGPLSFIGEIPDPAASCQSTGQPVSMPFGAVVSVYAPPGGTLSGFTLTPAGGQPLRACVLGGSLLLPDDALVPGTTYSATVLWQPTPQMAAQRISWQFTTAAAPSRPPVPAPPPQTNLPAPPQSTSPVTASPPPTAPPARFPSSSLPVPNPTVAPIAPAACTPSLRRAAARVTRPKTIAVAVRACGPGTATVGVYRRAPRTARERRALTHRRVTMRAAGTTTVRLRSRSLRLGRYALRATLRAAKAKRLTTTITIAAPARRR